MLVLDYRYNPVNTILLVSDTSNMTHPMTLGVYDTCEEIDILADWLQLFTQADIVNSDGMDTWALIRKERNFRLSCWFGWGNCE